MTERWQCFVLHAPAELLSQLQCIGSCLSGHILQGHAACRQLHSHRLLICPRLQGITGIFQRQQVRTKPGHSAPCQQVNSSAQVCENQFVQGSSSSDLNPDWISTCNRALYQCATGYPCIRAGQAFPSLKKSSRSLTSLSPCWVSSS